MYGLTNQVLILDENVVYKKDKVGFATIESPI